MSQRFGGKYSPDGNADGAVTEISAFEGARVDPVGARSNTMFLPAIPMVFLALNDGAIGLMLGLISASLLTLGAYLLREGLRAEAAFNQRKSARAPAFPRKLAAALLAGVGIALAAFRVDPGFFAPIIYGIATTGLHIGAFGIDPLKGKNLAGIDEFQQSRVSRVVSEAEDTLKSMREAVKRVNDRRIEQRVERFETRVREMIVTVEEDPRDLTAARKFLGVYLTGARDATVKFADFYARSRDDKARSDYLSLLEDLEKNFSERTQSLLLDDRSDMSVEIDVLRERLEREGVRLDRKK